MQLHMTRTPAARYVLIFAIAALAGPSAFAQSQAQPQSQIPETAGEDEQPSLWELRLAAFGQHAPVYPGSEDPNVTLLPIPIPVYRGSFLNFGENLDQVARGEITETRRLRLGVDLDFTFGEDSADIPVRRGMPDLDFMLEIGPELEIKLDNRTPEQGEFFLAFQLRAGVSFDGVDPSSQGFLLNPELEYRREVFRCAAERVKDSFSRETWRAFWLTTVDGESTEDVAALLGKTCGAVRIARCRVLARMKQEVEKIESD